ncbi:hypothetical protein [Cellulomonas alba]|uniref:Lipoprotein n=1 Tax=Cellulomonas alba TaxID=3053467 RepID=A0ABT7SFJ5_9CELL|nr:hypothetical protein [Cellulomonas alba]MDM7854294.1 hypothetical protein [Cellulomonas alba]
MALLTAGAGLAGCAPRVVAVSAPSAVVADDADCRAPQVLAALGLAESAAGAEATMTAAPAHADAPPAGTVPDGFTPVAVLECTPGGALRDAQGTWTSVTATRREGDLKPLLRALGHTTAESATASDEACEPHPDAIQLWLVDVLGQAIRVATPTSRCGVPVPAVVRAVGALEATDTATYPVQLVAAR